MIFNDQTIRPSVNSQKIIKELVILWVLTFRRSEKERKRKDRYLDLARELKNKQTVEHKMMGTPSLLLILGLLWPGVVELDTVSSMGQIDLFIYIYIIQLSYNCMPTDS